MPNFSNMNDADLIGWMMNFVTVATVEPAKYGLTSEQVTNISTKANSFAEKVMQRQTADEALKAAVLAQKMSRENVEPDVSYLNTIIKANPAVSDADKQSLGIEPNKPPTYTPPTRPDDLMVNGFQDGRNVLKWKRSGNKPNTMFIIECKIGESENFVYVDSTTETTFEHKGMTPGVRCAYRVKAKRSGEESTYSNEAVVY
ncbi:MAG TPA: fibronectin type III domain-containing protein [Pyrinomonadaceae bacterium]|nr:fibronectin type III domain-containing protein [Pyrinomonadaceae bacterium]